MAVLDAGELTTIRKNLASKEALVSWDKPTLNAASQAIEKWIETNRAAVYTEIDTATSPTKLTSAQKKTLLAVYMAQKATREGA